MVGFFVSSKVIKSDHPFPLDRMHFDIALTVQLADKTLPVVMLEELWEDRVGQFNAVEDIKHIALLGP